MIPVVFGITLILFFMLRLIPGDPASVMLGERATDAAVERINHELGLDQPIYIQYGYFLRDLATLRTPRVADIEIERAIADEKLAKERQQSLVLRAPLAGVVTKLEAAEGQEVGGRDTIAEVTAMGDLEARAEVDPDLLRVIRPGMNVEVRVMTVPPKVILDKVAYLVPYRSPQQGERRASVVVKIANSDASLQPGTPVMLTIKTQ